MLAVARQLMKARDVPLRLAALRAIGDLGDASDLPDLAELAAKAETATSTGRPRRADAIGSGQLAIAIVATGPIPYFFIFV